jgi:hypothetical protein
MGLNPSGFPDKSCDMERRIFTLEEANQLLPYLTSLLTRMQEKKKEVVSAIKGLEAMGVNVQELFGRTQVSEGESRTRVQLQQMGDEINALLTEVQDVGCLVKDIDKGLVDFWGRIHDQDVFLCWKLGEAEVAHWHQANEGFAQRKSLMTREILADVTKLH